MDILIVYSKRFYKYIDNIKDKLERMNINVHFPNCYGEDDIENKEKKMTEEEQKKFKREMIKRSEKIVKDVDEIIALNLDKEEDGKVYKNYIGGSTFLEMYEAFRYNKKIYLYNDIPEGLLYDEIHGFSPIVLNGDFSKIKS